jgi:Mn-dependent DtxR family transcriptional regulator
MLEKDEYKVLKKISEKHVVMRSELATSFKDFNPNVMKIIEKLIEKGYISTLSFGTTYLVITNSGLKALSEYEE